jgi:hypothetical protein
MNCELSFERFIISLIESIQASGRLRHIRKRGADREE